MKSEIAFIQRKLAPAGGGEMFALRFLGKMKERGHAITVLANKMDPSLKDRFQFVRIPLLKPFSFLKMWSFAWFARKAAKCGKYDLIFSNERTLYQDIYFAGEGCHNAWLRQRFRQLGPVKKFLIAINPLHWVIRILEKRCLKNRHLKGVIAFSERVSRELNQEYHLPPGKIKVVLHGVPAAETAPPTFNRKTLRKDLGIAEEEIVVLIIGSGFERKGLRFAIESLAHFDAPSFRLLVVGKGSTGVYRRLARKLGLENRVHFYGHNPNASLFYSIADVFVFPTLYEPFGLVVLEAMAHGVPVVVSACAGAAELLTHGENGLIAQDPFDPKEIGALLNQLQDADLRRTLAECGKQLAAEYNLDRNSKEILEAVEAFSPES
jgi:UDP-glucose:(heptosyl)LPS alpha-1,3-glucosyltransferase